MIYNFLYWVRHFLRLLIGADLLDRSLSNQQRKLPVNLTVKIVDLRTFHIGDIKIFAGKIPPPGWLFCDGSTLQISYYPELHKVIGNVFGGDERLTFCLPDLRGRVPVGAGQGQGLTDRDVGQYFGSESVVIDLKNLPISSSSNVRPIGKMSNYSVSGADAQPLNNMQPSLSLNYIIFAGQDTASECKIVHP